MEYNFKNPLLQQVNDDFSGGVKDIEETMKDLKTVFDTAQSAEKKALFFDEFKQIIGNYPAQIAAGLDFAPAPSANKWAHSFAEIMTEAIEFDPQNAPEMFANALKIEQNSSHHNSGILLHMADKIVSKYAHQKNKNIKQTNEAIKQTKIVLKALTEYWKDYAKSGQFDAATCKKFYEICTQAYPISPNILPVANEIHTEIEFLEGGYKLNKDIQSISQKPEDEAAKETFANHFETALKHNPQEAVADLLSNLKSISQIDNADTRNDIFTMATDAIVKSDISREYKSDFLMTFINKTMKAERDVALKENLGVAAMYMIKDALIDETGKLIMAEGKENQAFGALGKIAEVAGHRSELRELLSNMMEQYKGQNDKQAKVKEIMIKALDFEDATHKAVVPEKEPTVFEKRMRNVYKELKFTRQHNNEICELLNLNYAQSDYKFDVTKPTKASKKDLLKAANTLSQYKVIDPTLFGMMINKMDEKNFSNIDDKVIDAFSRVLDRVKFALPEDHAKIANRLTEVRMRTHADHIQQKVNPNMKPPHFEEKGKIVKTPQNDAPKTFKIQFGKEDLREG